MNELNTVVSTLAASLSTWVAFQSYILSKRVTSEAKSDDRLIFGEPDHPDLIQDDHAKSVLRIVIFNKSKRKAFVDNISVFTESGAKINITYSGCINECGMPQDPSNILGVVDHVSLYIRRNDGNAFTLGTKIILSTSFSTERITIVYNPLKSFLKD